MLRYVNGYIFKGKTFVVNKSDMIYAFDEEFEEGTALLDLDDDLKIVRCCECKYWDDFGYCNFHESKMFDDIDFCSYGRKKI